MEASWIGIEGLTELRPIGAGGFSTVYVALDTDFDRLVAVKVLHHLDDDGRRRFDRERGLMGALDDHPGVVTPYRSGYTTTGAPYLVMEHLAGGSLQDLLERDGPVDWRRAAELIRPVAATLEEAHRRGVLHRDVKPANILLTASGQPKLADFGIAIVRGAPATQIGFTLAHAPPETFISGTDRRDERSDTYSLASSLHTLVTGKAPFEIDGPDSPAAHLRRIEEQPIRPTGLDPGLDALLEAALAKDPEARPAPTGELGLRLGQILDRRPGAAGTTVPAPPGPRRPGLDAAGTRVAPGGSPGGGRPVSITVSIAVLAAVGLAALIALVAATRAVFEGGPGTTSPPAGATAAPGGDGSTATPATGTVATTPTATTPTATDPATTGPAVPNLPVASPACELTQTSLFPLCTSTNPSLTVGGPLYATDARSCSFELSVDWGDGSPPSALIHDGDLPGSEPRLDHVYQEPGSYTINVSDTVRSDDGGALANPGCATRSALYLFTLERS